MFVFETGAALTTYSAITTPSAFAWTITVWLWLTVVFANLAEALAEGRGKAQADTLRAAEHDDHDGGGGQDDPAAAGRPGSDRGGPLLY